MAKKQAKTSALKLHMEIEFLEETLGSSPSDKELLKNFIASNAPDALTRAEEIEMRGIDDVVEKDMTIFPRMKDGTLCSLNYQWEGFMKDACGMLRRVPGSLSSKESAYKKLIDGTIFVLERRIPYIYNEGDIGKCDRPLRASTMQGDRVAIASSETLPAGTRCKFTSLLLDSEKKDLVLEWFDYAALRGFSQWRNSGKGIFDYTYNEEEIDEDELRNLMRETRKQIIANIRAAREIQNNKETTSVEKPRRGRPKKSTTSKE